MDLYFFDTCALVPRYFPGPYTYRVNQVLGGGNRTINVCELTVIEMSSALAQTCRKHNLSVTRFLQMRSLFEDDLATGLLNVQIPIRADLLAARDLIEEAGVINRKDLRSSDAIIAATCRGYAYKMEKRVTFYTRDWKLYSSIRNVGSYRSALRLRYLGKGKGGVSPSTA